MTLALGPSLSEYGKLRHPPSKSDVLDCLKATSVTQLERYDPPPLQLMPVLLMDLHGYICIHQKVLKHLECTVVMKC